MGFSARALHYVFKIGNRQASHEFFTQTLGMKVLRHEEFEEGCKATCNGPYAGKWSKTMIGYGDEDEHFVLELTYNYGIGSYELGNDYRGIWIESDDAFGKLSEKGHDEGNGVRSVKDPDGHVFFVSKGKNVLTKVAISAKDLKKSSAFWGGLLTMKTVESSDKHTLLTFGEKQCQLELLPVDGELNRGKAFGRIAFSSPTSGLKEIQTKVEAEDKHYVQTPYTSLDTPGKATVHVVILRDPSEHEICFVGDEEYRQLSRVDPKAEKSIEEAIKSDDSDKCFKHGKPAAS